MSLLYFVYVTAWVDLFSLTFDIVCFLFKKQQQKNIRLLPWKLFFYFVHLFKLFQITTFLN